jgi:4-hydroxybenzoate polyprenyltransferase
MQAVLRQTAIVLEMIKFQHTVFALPFAFTAMLIAADGFPGAITVFWIVAACVFARTAAMSFNRWADRVIDARNPRTADRAIPAGLLSGRFVLLFAVLAAVGFITSAAMLNTLAFVLSPVALLILFGYSYAKRFTTLAHFVLGMALALAPVGAWVAVTGEIGLPAVLLGLGVMLWTSGFDLIYACQDVEVDRNEGLYSIPSRLGVGAALQISRLVHVLAVALFAVAGMVAGLSWGYFAGVVVVAVLLVAEHIVVDPTDMRRINIAFFTINSWVGMAIMAGTVVDILALR